MPRKARAKKPTKVSSTSVDAPNLSRPEPAKLSKAAGVSTSSSTGSSKPSDGNNNDATAGLRAGKRVGRGKDLAPNLAKPEPANKSSGNNEVEVPAKQKQSGKNECVRNRDRLRYAKRVLPMLKTAKTKICDMIPGLNEEEERPVLPVPKTSAKTGSSAKSTKSCWSDMDFSAPKDESAGQSRDEAKPKGRSVLDMSCSDDESECHDEGPLGGCASHTKPAMNDLERLLSHPLPVPRDLSLVASSSSATAPSRPVVEEYYACGQTRGLLRMWTDAGPQDDSDEFAEFEQWMEHNRKEDDKEKKKPSRRPRKQF